MNIPVPTESNSKLVCVHIMLVMLVSVRRAHLGLMTLFHVTLHQRVQSSNQNNTIYGYAHWKRDVASRDDNLPVTTQIVRSLSILGCSLPTILQPLIVDMATDRCMDCEFEIFMYVSLRGCLAVRET